MGLDITYLYTLTPRQFSNIQEGWNANIEMQTKVSWEQTRTLYDAIIRPHLKSKNKSIQELLPFPWDKIEVKPEQDELSSEEMEERWAEIDRRAVVSKSKL